MKTTLTLILLAITGMLVACTGVAAPTAAPELVRFKLAWTHGITYLGYYIADEKGFYADEGLTVQIDPVGMPEETATLPDVVAAGEYDFSIGASGATSALVTAQANGVPVAAIATIYQFSPVAFFTRADSGIVTPAGFEGHKVGITAESTRHYLEQLLAKSDITIDDVELVQVSFDMTPFYTGEVDVWVGYLTNEVVRARQHGLDIVTMPLYEYGIVEQADILFTRQELIDNDPDLAVRFLRASLRGWEWAIDNPTAAVDIMIERFPELAADRDFHLASFDAAIPLIRPPGQQVGSIDCEKWIARIDFAELASLQEPCTTEVLEAAREQQP